MHTCPADRSVGRLDPRIATVRAALPASTLDHQRNLQRSDALVLFGVTGDLAYKMIFPALYAMVKSGALTVPVVGVAGSTMTLEQLRARARKSIRAHGGIDDRAALSRLLALLQYVQGDYRS